MRKWRLVAHENLHLFYLDIIIFICIQILAIPQSHNLLIQMLLVDTKKFDLPKVYWKILYAAPAFDNTLVFMGMRAFREDILTHISADGKTVLKEIVFDQNTDSFGMLTDRQCCVLETRRNRMIVLDLDTDKEFYLDHEFKTEEADQSFIDVFPDSQSVVIRENGRYNNNTFKLTYYHYPLTPDSKPYHVFQENDGAWTYQFMVRKANNHSMYCWFKGRHDDGFEFRTYDLRDDPAGKYQIHKFPQEVGKNDGMNKTEVAITTMWEMTPGVFMFVCISSRKDEANNNYVCDTKTGVIREAKFTFGQYQPLTIDQMSFGNTCMFRTFDFENGKTLETPVYYISNETEEIVAQDTWYCSHLNKYTYVGYDSNMIIDSMFENGNVKEITVKATKVMQPKEITVHFLNEIIDDCDDDLLYEVSKVIDYSKKA